MNAPLTRPDEDILPQAGTRVLVAMSGGVDSSVAGLLLHEAGCELIGVNMRTHRLTAEERRLGAAIKTCCSPVDARDARLVAERCGFPFYVLDVEPAFERDVIDPFIRAYQGGRTPNPCVLCNSHVKLGMLLEKARVWGCDLVATGHYARRVRMPASGRWTLQRAADATKDQTYYLYGLEQWQLERLLLPLGGLTKAETRELARRGGLATAEKPESMEICFIPSNDYRRFLRERFAARGIDMPHGRIMTTTGTVLGEHNGLHEYTVGQRRGLGVASAEPLYVVALDAETNTVIVGRREETAFPALVADGLNWMGLEALPATPLRARVQIRHRHAAAQATITPGPDADSVHVAFDVPQSSVAPGQAVVFYDDEGRVLGGGWIREGVARHAE